jgi:hypothetical protein
MVGNMPFSASVKGDDKTCRTDANAHVGHIESGPVPVPDIKIQKIHHHAHPDAVYQIAQGSAKNEAQTAYVKPALVFLAAGQDKNESQGQK